MANYALLIAILGSLHFCDAFKILAVFPMPSPSHSILGDGYVKLLLEAGHEITYITPYPKKQKAHPNLHVIDVSELQKLSPSNLVSLKKVLENQIPLSEYTKFFSFLSKITETTIENENVQNFIKDTSQQFDLVILQYIYSDILSGFAAYYNCPYIWAFSIAPDSMLISMIHEMSNPAYYPMAMVADIPPLTFTQRAKGLLLSGFIAAFKEFYIIPKEKGIYEETFATYIKNKGRSPPAFEEMIYNASFVLSNYHESLGHPISIPPNCKTIAGYHIDTKTKAMEKDLQQIMDNAQHGVIYFSMGSNLKSKDLPDVLKQDIIKVLGGVKQTVIWKFEEEFPNLPKNVHILKWAPQQNILAHNNTRLFITHGGFGSTIETIHFGVPVITIPVFADQFVNANKAVLKGYGIKVTLGYEMAGDLKLALEEVFRDPRYARRAKELSQIYHDRPLTPAKELVHWVEHVIKTGGAPHLRSPALVLSWYQKMYLDLAAVIVISLYALKFIVKKLYRSIRPVDVKKKTN